MSGDLFAMTVGDLTIHAEGTVTNPEPEPDADPEGEDE